VESTGPVASLGTLTDADGNFVNCHLGGLAVAESDAAVILDIPGLNPDSVDAAGLCHFVS